MPTPAVRKPNPSGNIDGHDVFAFLTAPYENEENRARCDRLIRQKQQRLDELLAMIKKLKVNSQTMIFTEFINSREWKQN